MRNKRKGYQTQKTTQKGTNGRCSTLVEESNGVPTVYVPCINNYEEKPRKHISMRASR